MSLPVSSVMRAKLVTCDVNASLRKVSEEVLKENVGSILVSRGEEIVGIITQNDLLRAVLNNLDFNDTSAKDIMSQPLDACEIDDDLEVALKKFKETGRSRLIVKQKGKVIGVLKKSIAERFKGITKVYHFTGSTRSLPFRKGRGD